MTQTQTETAYTLADLLALPDGALNALAASLFLPHLEVDVAGYYRYKDRQRPSDHIPVFASPGCNDSLVPQWEPTSNRNQSGELLVHAAAQGVYCEVIFFARTVRSGAIRLHFSDATNLRIEGNGARAETAAAIAAMLALQGRLRQ